MGKIQDILRRERDIDAREKALLEKEEALKTSTPAPEFTPVFSPQERVKHAAKGCIGTVLRVARHPAGFLYHVRWSEGPAREGTCRRQELVSAELVPAPSELVFQGEPKNKEEAAEWWARGWRPSNMCRECPGPVTPCKACWVRAGYEADRYDERYSEIEDPVAALLSSNSVEAENAKE